MGHFYSLVLPWEPNNENIKYRVSKKQGYSDNSVFTMGISQCQTSQISFSNSIWKIFGLSTLFNGSALLDWFTEILLTIFHPNHPDCFPATISS